MRKRLKKILFSNDTIASITNWILAFGSWNDSGIWDDTAQWKDS